MRTGRRLVAGLAAAVVGGAPLWVGVPAASAGAASDGVRSAIDNCVHATSTVHDTSVAQQQMDPQAAWPLSRGAGVLVAVVDTGIAAGNPQLSGAVSAAAGAQPGSDCTGHGTRMAGIIAARPRAGTGMVGMAPGARVELAVAPTGQALQTPSAAALAAAINTAAGTGAKVIVVPYAVAAGTEALHRAVRKAVAGGALVVAAAGSDSTESQGRPPTYPAAYPEALAVAGVTAEGRPADGSAAGSFVDLAAPATNVTSTAPPTGQNTGDGVSNAAAYVAGAAALLRSYRPDLTVRQVTSRLELTATRPQAGGRANDQIGWGVVDAGRALSAVLPSEGPANLVPGQSAAPSLAPAAVAGRSDMTPQLVAASTAGGALALVLLSAWVWLLVRHRRTRRSPG